MSKWKCDTCHYHSFFLWYYEDGVRQVRSCMLCKKTNKNGCAAYLEKQRGEVE